MCPCVVESESFVTVPFFSFSFISTSSLFYFPFVCCLSYATTHKQAYTKTKENTQMRGGGKKRREREKEKENNMDHGETKVYCILLSVIHAFILCVFLSDSVPPPLPFIGLIWTVFLVTSSSLLDSTVISSHKVTVHHLGITCMCENTRMKI